MYRSQVRYTSRIIFLMDGVHGYYVNSLFVFGPDGKIYLYVLNAPGTFHDSIMADYHV